MDWRSGLKHSGEAVALLLALSFVFSVQFIPHLDTFRDAPREEQGLEELGKAMYNFAEGDREGYPYAIHVDEHLHWVWITQTQRHDQIVPGHPYDEDPEELSAFTSLRGAVHERGYHVLVAQVQELTGVSFYHLYWFLPALWMTFIAFSVYTLVRPHPGAIPAAAFVGLAPTTLRFMGTGFFVPIAFVLAWLPIVAILTRPAKQRFGAGVLLFLVTAWAFFVHLIGGFAAVAIIGASIIVGRAKDWRSALTLLAASLIPIAWLYRSFTGDVQSEIAKEETLPIDLTIFDKFGLLVMLLWAAGLVLYTLSPPPEEKRGPVYAYAGLSVFALGLIVGGLYFDWGRYATYARWHPPFFVAAAVPAGHAVGVLGQKLSQGIRKGASWLGERWRPATYTGYAGPVAGVALAVTLVTTAAAGPVSFHLTEPYYQVMNDDVWAAYKEVDRNVGEDHQVFLTHPWRAPFLTAMTGKTPHAVLLPGAPPNNGQDYNRYVNDGGSLEMFIMNDITLVVGPRPPAPDVFEQVGPGTWAMDEDIAREIAEIRAGERRN